MRTATTKQLEAMTFDKLSDWSIIIGVTKTLWKRHSDIFFITVAWVEFAIIIWMKLGK